MNLYGILVLWNDIAMWLIGAALFFNRTTRRLLGMALFMIGWLIGRRAQATRIWLQQEGY